jgi:dTDP-4-dehydrorhamnose 3,5-epimerase-like enzyme
MLWILAGFLHGFRATSENTHVLYKTTDYYANSTNALWRETIRD